MSQEEPIAAALTVTEQTEKDWLALMQQGVAAIGMKWEEPNRVAWQTEEITSLEWWHGDKKLSVYVDEKEVTYLRSWGGPKGPLLGGNCEHPDTCCLLWQWLMSEEKS